MKITPEVKKILDNYAGESPAVKANLARMLMEGKLSGTGKMIILPVDQGFEHGPDRSFAMNEAAYDPMYHHQLAIEAGLSAYAAPLGPLEASSDAFAGAIPTILKVNSSNSLSRRKEDPTQAITATVKDAVRLGCSAIGFTIYPGSDDMFAMYEDIKEMSREAKEYGIATVIWSYARGGMLSKEGETAIDVISYGAHMAALLGAHIIKVKLPSAHVELAETKKIFAEKNIDISTMDKRVAHVVKCCFNGRRIVVFSGGEAKDDQSVMNDAKAILAGGGNGSIIGRNAFQRPHNDALKLLDNMVKIYQGK